MTLAAEGFFRSKTGFTVVQNYITRDKNISLKAKGLYLIIQAYITMPDKQWRKDDFFNMSKEGTKAFDNAWKELKDAGYLKVHIMAGDGVWHTEYELLDEPIAGAHTLYHNKAGEITSDNIKRAAKQQIRQMQDQEDAVGEVPDNAEYAPKNHEINEPSDHYPPFGSNGTNVDNFDHYPPYGSNGNGSNGYGSNGNGNNGYGTNGNGGNNNKSYNKNPFNKTYNINPNHNPYPAEQSEVVHQYTMEFLSDFYHADEMIQMGMDEKDVDMILEIIYDTLNTSKTYLWVNREKKPIDIIRSRLLKLDLWDIQYAINQYKKQTTEIRHQKAYMLSVLFTAKGQGNLDITNQVMHDMYGWKGDGSDG